MSPPTRTRVAIESPYAGQVERNEAFARNVCRFAVLTGEYNPYAMHLFFTQFLNDDAQHERDLGIACGLDWTDQAEEVWQCTRPDESLTPGMDIARRRNLARVERGEIVTLRRLYFSQDGRLMGGWEGPLPDVPEDLLGPSYRPTSRRAPTRR